MRNNPIFEVFTPTEAAIVWGLDESTIRKSIYNGKFIEGVDYRKSGRITLISKVAIERLYGKIPENKNI